MVVLFYAWFWVLIKEIYCDIELVVTNCNFYIITMHTRSDVQCSPLHHRNVTILETVCHCQYPQWIGQRFGVHCCLTTSAVNCCFINIASINLTCRISSTCKMRSCAQAAWWTAILIPAFARAWSIQNTIDRARVLSRGFQLREGAWWALQVGLNNFHKRSKRNNLNKIIL